MIDNINSIFKNIVNFFFHRSEFWHDNYLKNRNDITVVFY